jgi:DNA primase
MSRIPPHIVDDIMQASRIEEVIGEFVQLKRAGSNLKGLSPFSDERTPSFVVSPAKQIFKCFSSGKGGTVVTFLMEKEHFSYPEALKWLADKYNIELPEERPMTDEEQAKITEKESLFIINDFAKNHFQERLLQHEEGQAIGLSYFEERGFRRDIIELFQLGYCLNSGDDFTRTALTKGYKKHLLEQVGLIKSKDNRSFDFFRGRVLFPIHSISGRVLGFGGRTLQSDKKIAKYFNSPESSIYNKSEILYGLFFAKSDIIKQDNCFLCEGYTDVISLYQAGLKNVVASSGTALTKEQIRLIRRYTPNITILYDGDAAGIKASFRGIDLILEEGMNVKVVLFPDGEDPDSFARNRSSSELESYLEENRKDFISFKAGILLKGTESDPIQRATLIRDVMQSVSLIPDQITRSVYAQEIAKEFGMQEEVILAELFKIRKASLSRQHQAPELNEFTIQNPAPTQSVEVKLQDLKAQAQQEAEYELIRLVVRYGTVMIEVQHKTEDEQSEEVQASVIEVIYHEMRKDELHFQIPIYERLFQVLTEGLMEGVLYSSSYLKRLEDQELVQLVSALETDEHECSGQWLGQFNIVTRTEKDRLNEAVIHALFRFKTLRIEQLIGSIHQRLAEENSLSEEEQQALLLEQITYERIKMKFSEHLGRTILP